jgi:hypothetical protein
MPPPPRKLDPVRELTERLVRERDELEARLVEIVPLRRRLRQIRASLRMLERLEQEAPPAPPRQRFDA